MPQRFATLSQLYDHGFDAVIDVRSPSEFAEDHIPGAINLPALDDDERAKVGTIYVQQSAFLARKIGAALVARNAARHIEEHLMNHDGGWRPLVYCWRGGQRSGSFASILAQIGWRVETVEGGYQSYRRLVSAALYDHPLGRQVILIDGNTGTAKTDILHRMRSRGIQVLDLEGMARHRGSVLGSLPGGQPAQKAFESALAKALAATTPDAPLILEAESSKIGKLTLPPALWSAMKDAPRIVIDAPLEARAAYLTEAYADMMADPDRLKARLAALKPFRGAEAVAHWSELAEAGDFRRLASELMEQHYDPAYRKSRRRAEGDVLATVTAETLDAAGRDTAADQIAAILSQTTVM
ncbi:tRNA 2-selenouridine(34) synthase MnmH [Aestuariibius sp. 2305UL40-4]|uniref:tRNA 2-selenouridine(34) synthase MnmH n=1 Tax=Aestuariibius violaceus TaxID=3234132 RepID=UPI00345F112B